MRQRVIDRLERNVNDSDALAPVRRERFLVYLMGPYRTFDVESLLPDDVDPDSESLPSFATWDESTGEYAEDDVLRLLEETRDCLRNRGFNAFLAIDVGIDLEEMDAATQSIEFANASNATVFIAPAVGDNLGVGIEIGSVLEDLLGRIDGEPAAATPPAAADRFLVTTEPNVRSAMLGAVQRRWDGSVRTFEDADELCRSCAQFCTHIQNRELYGDLSRLE
ncbi:DUF7509 family protein [Natronolimnohabitans innermongolicus]|uniref:DUF7509 domain-containing protein n=1 Tax=Natronolimnohabitans innermongolicus JCM 12255 TaxID=1227499 RepID=L9XN21_9EURY|nr:hypothetical protein [Natronolimnohabitans innermongolicus]ELY62028.1 hypothetical protein C493_01135 [Natronolimnohabitans innermongolicus JCM 12255]